MEYLKMTEKEFYNTCNILEVKVKVNRRSMDSVYASLRMWGISPDHLQYDEHRTDVIIFQWNQCKPQVYFKLMKWTDGWTKNAVIDVKFNNYDK